MKRCLIALLATAVTAPALAQMTTQAEPIEVESALRVPAEDYRTHWVQIGAFSLLADDPADGAHQIHTVYVEKSALETYLGNGDFADGTKIVKEVWSARTEELTTGTASYVDELQGRFVMVRDSDGTLGTGARFGDGWGWAFFEGSETSVTVTRDYGTDCIACHEPARDQGLIYLQGYPAIRK
ncbi:cytochrome c, class I [Maritimibacter sp. 55A14]|uniref:cytochrome P460 family protein n=1 Tax=Maritimibacter sp. 55A14 TaxID=2174844 RepID=UPI000D621017|nr:cytochrome P460 family protein [Maritimibacter sp. 55A14]PWE34007.1 cytochrome c, class I [Maritimibacter sp. 55A14]